MEKLQYDGPIVLAILDGIGLALDGPGNAVSKARTPFMGNLVRNYPHLALEASGEAVGLPHGQMGNSEVGHNTMGVGRVVKQGAALVEEFFETGKVFESEAWRGAISRVLNRGGGDDTIDKNSKVWYNGILGYATLHFAGIFSDGGVHSDMAHLFKMIDRAYSEGVRRMRVHAVLDGRDTSPQSALTYIDQFEEFARKYPDADIRIADGGGRMVYVADRYENDWEIVARGWDAMVNGQADFYFKSAREAVEMLRRIDPGVQDQYLAPFVVVDDKEQPVGLVRAGDAMIYFDFRADRAVEMMEAFVEEDFKHFNRGAYRPMEVYFVGMTEYDADRHLPKHRLVEPSKLEGTLSRFLGERGVRQLACSETVKFGHVTYYFNGNSRIAAPGEEFVEIGSDTEPFETRPWMKSAEITDEVIRRAQDFDFIRINYAGGDMVGHTADFNATVVAVEAIDIALARLVARVDELGGALVVVADHGNAEELLDVAGQKKTAHTANRVPFMIYDNTKNREKYAMRAVENPGLKNLAATMAVMLGQNDYPGEWADALIGLEKE